MPVLARAAVGHGLSPADLWTPPLDRALHGEEAEPRVEVAGRAAAVAGAGDAVVAAVAAVVVASSCVALGGLLYRQAVASVVASTLQHLPSPALVKLPQLLLHVSLTTLQLMHLPDSAAAAAVVAVAADVDADDST